MRSADLRIYDILRGHDPRGMDLLFDVYYRPLVLWADTFLGDIPASEDLVQELFVAFWERRLYMNLSPGGLRSYFFAAVKNLALKYLNKKDPLRHVTRTFPLIPDAIHPEDITEQMLQALTAEIEKLPPRTRQVLKAFYFEGLRYREIAEKFEISLATVKTLLVKALKKLREIFSHYRVIS